MDDQEKNGVYCAFNLEEESVKALEDFIAANNIPNKSKRFHVTLQYARECEADADDVVFGINRDFKTAPSKMTVKTGTFDVFNTQDGKRALVLKLNSLILLMVHKTMKMKYALSYDYPNYVPHVTLSYDIGEMSIGDLDISTLPDKIVLVKPYAEELILDWQNKGSE